MKIKCADCANIEDRKCLVKKTTISPNKARVCKDYSFDSSREVARLERKVRLRDKADASNPHPLTGDLSRFKTTASE